MVIRRLRGLRVQLLLWTILPLAIVLIVLSLAGITRHRQAMTLLVTDRDRGLTLAEANRLAREIEGRVALLIHSASTTGADLAAATDNLYAHFAGGLALVDSAGKVRAVSARAQSWPQSPEAGVLAARVAAAGQPQFQVLIAGDHDATLLIGAPLTRQPVDPAGGDTMQVSLIGAIPIETLDLAASSQAVERETHGAIFVLDAAGRLIHHYNPNRLHVDTATLASLPRSSVERVGSTELRGDSHDLLVTYALVMPLGWLLITAEDVHAISAMGMSVVEVLPLLLLFVALIALLAVSFGMVNIVRPLQELDRRAARVAWGDFDAVQQPVGGVREMDELRATLAQMADRIRSYQIGMRDYLSAVTQAQEEERSRLAHELHDETVQALIALKQRAQMARKAMAPSSAGLAVNPTRAASRLIELEGLIDRELASLRRLISDLRPIYLEDLGFVPALEMLAQQTGEHYGLAVRLDVSGAVVRLAPDMELAAYRIVQQALANAAAHASAQRVTVSVEFALAGLTLTVQDDGRGFTPPEQPADLARQGHFGLMGMHERALLYGGHLTITASPGHGCTIRVWLPVR